MSGRQGLCQFFLLFRRLPNRSLETWEDTYPYRQDGLLCADLLPHCLLLVQSGLLGFLPLPVKRYGCYWCGSYSLNLMERECPKSTYIIPWVVYNTLNLFLCSNLVNCIHVIWFAPNSPVVNKCNLSYTVCCVSNLQGQVKLEQEHWKQTRFCFPRQELQ